MINTSNLSDRELLESIYALLLLLIRKTESAEENANDFTMNVIANVFADRLLNGYGKR